MYLNKIDLPSSTHYAGKGGQMFCFKHIIVYHRTVVKGKFYIFSIKIHETCEIQLKMNKYTKILPHMQEDRCLCSFMLSYRALTIASVSNASLTGCCLMAFSSDASRLRQRRIRQPRFRLRFRNFCLLSYRALTIASVSNASLTVCCLMAFGSDASRLRQRRIRRPRFRQRFRNFCLLSYRALTIASVSLAMTNSSLVGIMNTLTLESGLEISVAVL